MSDLQIGQVERLHLCWLILFCLAVALLALLRGKQIAKRFATPSMLQRLVPNLDVSMPIRNGLLSCLTMGFLVLALIDVRWGQVWREVPQKGIEVMFVLDVSRSMLANDVTPSRLDRAKQQISETIHEMTGDRVGLILFAGEVQQKIPLTNHYEDFRQTLREVGPADISRGGSRLGDAIRVASQGFLGKTNDHKVIVLFTDGEDQESDPIAAANAAKSEHGVRIFAVGLGDLSKGARVPSRDGAGYVKHHGEDVISKLNGEVLSQIAVATDGAYIPAGTKRVDMADVYHGYIANVQQDEFSTARINRYEARYQWFLAPAILLLLLEVWLSTRPVRTDSKSRKRNPADRSIVLKDHEPSSGPLDRSQRETLEVSA